MTSSPRLPVASAPDTLRDYARLRRPERPVHRGGRLFTANFTKSAGATDPIQVTVRNDDASIVIYLGDSDVSSSNGFALIAGAAVSFDIQSPADWRELYAIAASGTPELHIFAIGPSVRTPDHDPLRPYGDGGYPRPPPLRVLHGRRCRRRLHAAVAQPALWSDPSDAATVTISGSSGAYIGASGLVLLGTGTDYAESPNLALHPDHWQHRHHRQGDGHRLDSSGEHEHRRKLTAGANGWGLTLIATTGVLRLEIPGVVDLNSTVGTGLTDGATRSGCEQPATPRRVMRTST